MRMRRRRREKKLPRYAEEISRFRRGRRIRGCIFMQEAAAKKEGRRSGLEQESWIMAGIEPQSGAMVEGLTRHGHRRES
jgi:hypothetical protein